MSDESSNGDREKLLRRAHWLEIATIVYNVIEAGVTMTVGFMKGSSALVSFGADAVVEAVSASMLLWRIRGEETDVGEVAMNRRKRWSFWTLCVVFTILAGFIVYEAGSKFVSQKESKFSAIGVGILCLSLAVNPFLAYFKSRTGKQADLEALVMDSREQIVCLYMTVVVLAGLLLTKYLGWWWADPAAALLIVPYVLYQAWEAFKKARKVGRKDK